MSLKKREFYLLFPSAPLLILGKHLYCKEFFINEFFTNTSFLFLYLGKFRVPVYQIFKEKIIEGDEAGG